MELTDLEYLIEYFEKLQQECYIARRNGRNEPEGEYAKMSLSVINTRLSILRDLKRNHGKISVKVKDIEAIRSYIKMTGKRFVEQISMPKSEHQSFMEQYLKTDFWIEQYVSRIKDYQKKLLAAETELSELEFDGEEGCKPDKIYELIEALYDDRLGSFEIRFPGNRKPINLKMILEKERASIKISIVHITKAVYQHQYAHEQESLLNHIGYERIQEKWRLDFDCDKQKFDDLIIIISRTLFEVFHTMNTSLEVVYNDYE